MYTIKKINDDETILPGVRLGVIALDSCDNSAYALEQSLDFIKGMLIADCFCLWNMMCNLFDCFIFKSFT